MIGADKSEKETRRNKMAAWPYRDVPCVRVLNVKFSFFFYNIIIPSRVWMQDKNEEELSDAPPVHSILDTSAILSRVPPLPKSRERKNRRKTSVNNKNNNIISLCSFPTSWFMTLQTPNIVPKRVLYKKTEANICSRKRAGSKQELQTSSSQGSPMQMALLPPIYVFCAFSRLAGISNKSERWCF